MNLNKKKLNVYVVGISKSYANFLTCEFKLVSEMKNADIVLFTGGEDVNPAYYEEHEGKYTSHNSRRDEEEYSEFQNALKLKKLMVGICRGSQLLTVMSGGSLIQHVSNHAGGNHSITIIEENRNINITSTHHQMMFPYSMDKSNYTIIAKATGNISKTFLNGENHEKKLPIDFVECEIVYYNKTNCLCIQGHPEMMSHDSDAVAFVNVLVEELLEDQNSSMCDEELVHERNIERLLVAENNIRPREARWEQQNVIDLNELLDQVRQDELDIENPGLDFRQLMREREDRMIIQQERNRIQQQHRIEVVRNRLLDDPIIL